MRLLRIAQPFDHPEFIFEPKIDGFRALAYVRGHHCELVSRNGHVFKSWPYLAEEIGHAVRAQHVPKRRQPNILAQDQARGVHASGRTTRAV